MQMSVSGEGGGSRVRRNWKITKIPWFMAPMKLLIAAATPMPDGKMAKKVKAELEGSD